MILVDTSVWVDHLRSGNAILARLLEQDAVLVHPWVTGELALGSLQHREEVIGLLLALPRATEVRDHELLHLIDQQALFGTGIGYVDAQLLASTRLTPDARLWTGDERLASAALRLGIEFDPSRRPDGATESTSRRAIQPDSR